MSTILKFIIYSVILGLIMTSTFILSEPGFKVNEEMPGPSDELRGVWVATVLNIDYPKNPTTEVEQLKKEAIKILDNVKEIGLNAVFLQVRPSADAFYRSEYYPWSKYLTGEQGLAPANNFDPLKFWIEEAHSRGIELHAWINPYRITKKTSQDNSHDFASLAPTNPAVLNPEWVIKHKDGNLYFDPGLQEVRQLITDSILELINNYNVDGIHFDDYFYPGKDFEDNHTFAKYGAPFIDIDDWRRDNVNRLITDLSREIKQADDDISFGISPFGIWANASSDPLGSITNGTQSYFDHYADTRKWVKDGTIDYIAPQLYWNIGFNVADYSTLLSWWADVVQNTGVDLYIGHAAYRTGNSDPESPWYGVEEIKRQLQLNFNTPEVKGSIYFSNNTIFNSTDLKQLLISIYQEKDAK